MILTFWMAQPTTGVGLEDAILAKTKRQAQEMVNERYEKACKFLGEGLRAYHYPPERRSLTFSDNFDLMCKALRGEI